MNYITLNGVSSNTITGLLIQELPPISLPKMRTEINEIDGRDGDIVTELGYSAYDKEISIGLHGSFDINQVIAFFASKGTVIFSNEPDKYYRYQVIEQIDFERLVRFRTATVKMHCQPFKYDAEETEIDEDGGEVLTGDIVTFNSVSTDPLTDVKVSLSPVQNLNGYANPWPSGGNPYNICFKSIPNANIESNGRISVNSEYALGVFPVTQGTTYIVRNSTSGTGQLLMAYYTSEPSSESVSYNSSRIIGGANPFTAEITGYVAFRCVSSFTQFQAETGTTLHAYAPYSNICPITGWTGANVYRTGVNVWDEQWELGALDTTTGEKASNSSKIRSKNYIPIVPNTKYYFNLLPTGCDMCFYDANGTFVGTAKISTSGTKLLTTPNNAYKMLFGVYSTYGTTYNNDISINYPSTDHSYHAYSGNTYSIPFGQTVYGGTLDVTTGLLTVDRASVDLGTLTWVKRTTSTNHYRFTADTDVYMPSSASTVPNIICSAYPTVTPNDTWVGVMGVSCNNGTSQILACDETYANATAFKTAMSGVQLVYQLASPQTVSLTATEVDALLGINNIWSAEGTVEVTVPNILTVTNKGNTIARPRMTIYGSGNVNVIINGIQVFSIAMGDIGYITIDGEQMEATQGEGVLKNRLVTGDYSDFVLQSGENIIALTGNVTEVQISNYSRWL